MNTLGSKIRSLRKSKKMTLVDLAGDYMTKGMLSLIENDKNNPSMESLEYIAKKLDTTVSVLLEDGDEEITNQIYNKVKEIINVPSLFHNEVIKQTVSPYIDQIKQNRKGAFIFQWYAFTKGIEKDDKTAMHYLTMAKEIYIKNDDKNALLDVENDLISVYFILGKYDSAFTKGVELYEKYKEDNDITDPNLIPRLLLSIAAYGYSSYDTSNLIKYLELAEEVSIQNKTFKLLSPIYKSQCFKYLLDEDMDKYQSTYKKFDILKQFNPEDFQTKFDMYTADLIYHFYRREYKELKNLLEVQQQILVHDKYQTEVDDNFNNIWQLYEAIALYNLGDFDNAIKKLNDYPNDIPYLAPADISIHAQKYTYLAINAERKNDNDNAKEYIMKAMDIIKNIPSNHFTKITEDTYKRIMNQNKPTDYLS